MKSPLLPALASAAPALLILSAWLGFAATTSRLEKIQPPSITGEMEVAIPRFMQVAMACGDRFLATNISVFRALTVSTENQQPERFLIQARVQSDAAWLNPYNEDNYYLTAAALSWNEQLDAAQQILAAASDARRFDMLPPFFYAFNQLYFRHDPVSGAEWLKVAAQHTQSEQERLSLNRIAANWMVKGQDRRQALKMLEVMAVQSRYGSLRRQILLRAERVRHLIQLDEAVTSYTQRYHHLPTSLEDLMRSRILVELPQDPMGQGYMLDAQGKAQLKTPPKK